jgi:hypothetical protein
MHPFYDSSSWRSSISGDEEGIPSSSNLETNYSVSKDRNSFAKRSDVTHDKDCLSIAKRSEVKLKKNTNWRDNFKEVEKYMWKYEKNTIPETLYIPIDIKTFFINCVYLSEIKKNKVIDGTFSSIIYSELNTSFNGVYLRINSHDLLQNDDITTILVNIENQIIDYYKLRFSCVKNHINIIQSYMTSLKKQLCQSKHCNDATRNILKISGVWESKTNIGITLKIVV